MRAKPRRRIDAWWLILTRCCLTIALMHALPTRLFASGSAGRYPSEDCSGIAVSHWLPEAAATETDFLSELYCDGGLSHARALPAHYFELTWGWRVALPIMTITLQVLHSLAVIRRRRAAQPARELN